MTARAVMGLVDNPTQANASVERLRAAGFTDDDISLLVPDEHGARDFAFERRSKAPEGAVLGGGLGVVVGGLVGMATGIGVLVVPGLGALVAAGPVLAATSVALVLGVAFGLAGGLAGSQVPEIEAKHYESRPTTGRRILLGVHTRSRAEARRARAVLRSALATDITSAPEATVPIDART